VTINVLRDLLQQRPFEPFEVVSSSGDRYVVAHPENCILMKDRVVVAYGASRRRQQLPEHAAFLSYLHIAAAEPIGKRRDGRHNGNS
jgi:hypothetical protein